MTRRDKLRSNRLKEVSKTNESNTIQILNANLHAIVHNESSYMSNILDDSKYFQSEIDFSRS
jgi:hypothetical protein